MRNCNKKSLIATICILLLSCLMTSQFAYAEINDEDKIQYTIQDSENEDSIDSELFDNTEYEEYDIYTIEDDDNEDTSEMIILAPENNTNDKKSKTTLNATIEKSYSFRSIQAFNTIWDNSDNFRTTFRTTPSLMQTAPSVIHAANYKFRPDNQTSIYWGHASLSSQDDVSVGFVGKLESDYDSGMKINTKIGKLNVSTGIYESLETNNASGGIVISSDELKLAGLKGTLKLGGGFYANEYGDNTSSKNSTGIFARYKQGNFSIAAQIGETQYSDNNSKFGTSIYINPQYQLTKTVSLTSKIASHLDQNYTQEEVGITYKPIKNNPNEVSFSVNATMYNGEGTTNKQRLKFSTEFKL